MPAPTVRRNIFVLTVVVMYKKTYWNLSALLPRNEFPDGGVPELKTDCALHLDDNTDLIPEKHFIEF